LVKDVSSIKSKKSTFGNCIPKYGIKKKRAKTIAWEKRNGARHHVDNGNLWLVKRRAQEMKGTPRERKG